MPKAKCTEKLIGQVRVLREKNLPWRDVARAVGVDKSTLLEYKKPESNSYNKVFADIQLSGVPAQSLSGSSKPGF